MSNDFDPSQAPGAAVKVAGTASFSKFMQLLQLVADADGPIGIGRLSVLSGYPRPSVHRMVAAMVAERMLEESVLTGDLRLGPRLIHLASRSWESSELRGLAQAELERLRDITGETVHLAVPNGLFMTYIEKLESPSNVRMASTIGTNVPLYSTSVGKAYLAALPEADCEALVVQLQLQPRMPNTLVSQDALRQQLQEVKLRGWALDDEENEAGIQCFGAVIRDRRSAPVAAISVSTLRFRQRGDVESSYVQPLMYACDAISLKVRQLLR